MTNTIYASEPHRGWLPWALLSPVICILLVAISSVPLDIALQRVGAMNANGQPGSAAGFCLNLALPFAGMGAAIWAWSRLVERRSLATMGLTGTHGLRKYLAGLAIGVGMMVLAVVSIWLAGGYVSDDVLPAFSSAASLFWIAMLLLGFIFQSGVEEFIFRGWLLSTATRRWNLPVGFIASSVAFAFLHFSPHQPFSETILAFLFGLFACSWAWRANSIWGVMGWHAGWNWITGVGFAVPITGFDMKVPALLVKLTPVGPDFLTGGKAGPEGSVITTSMLVVAMLILLVWPGGLLRTMAGTPTRDREHRYRRAGETRLLAAAPREDTRGRTNRPNGSFDGY